MQFLTLKSTGRNKLVFIVLALLMPLIFIDNVWIPAALIIFLILLFVYQQSFGIIFIVVSFLILTSSINPQLRFIVQIINIILLIYFSFRQQKRDPELFKHLPKDLIFFISGFLVVMLLSTVFSSYTPTGFEQILRTLIFLIIIYGLYIQIKSDKEVKLLLYSLTAVAVFYSLYLIYELYINDFVFISVQQQLTYVYGGGYLNKNFIGGFISIIIILLVSFLFKPDINRILYFTLIIILFVGVLLTNSRAALLSLFIAIPVVLLLFKKQYLYKYFIFTSLAAIMILFSPLADFIQVYVRLESVSTGRDYLAESSIEVIKNHFLLGAGPAATRYEMYNHLNYMLGSPEELFLRRNFYQKESGQAHSFYLFLFSDLGILGFILSIFLPVIFFKYVWKLIKYYKTETDYYYLFRGLMAAGVFIFIRALFEPAGIITYGHLNQDLHFWIIVIIVVFYYNRIPLKS
jgi:O-antigen ligase